MAKNVVVTAGTGTTIAADEVVDGTLGTAKVGYVKIMDGTIDGTTKLTIGAGGALVDLGANNDVTVSSGSITANAGTNLNTSALALETGGNLAAAATSLAILDDWDESDRAKVNPIAGQAGVQGGSGTVNALTQRMVLATDVPLPAGTNNIGDVDILTIPGIAGDIANDSADSGNPIKIGGYAKAAAPTAVSADADRVNAWFDLSGRLIIRQVSGTATLANVSSSATNVTLQAANTSRLGWVCHNDSTQILYVKFGATASSTSFTYKLQAGDTLELPIVAYTGIIDGIWASANGNARVTELT